MPSFSVIVPVYNRPSEIDDLLRSLAEQTDRDFEVVIVEDGSTVPCKDVVDRYAGQVDVHYHYKDNEGRSIARNYGIERATGDYFVFFDSDCVIPRDYFANLRAALDRDYVPCFGGPDAAGDDFTDLQKAISFSMTAFLTTGGIRGGKVQLEKFVPRSFNMGYSREVWQQVGGFREMFSEDIDMSTRIRQAGFGIRLIREACVYHKRRTRLAKFARQTHVFGAVHAGLCRAGGAGAVLALVGRAAHRTLCGDALGERAVQHPEPENRVDGSGDEFRAVVELRCRIHPRLGVENPAAPRTGHRSGNSDEKRKMIQVDLNRGQWREPNTHLSSLITHHHVHHGPFHQLMWSSRYAKMTLGGSDRRERGPRHRKPVKEPRQWKISRPER